MVGPSDEAAEEKQWDDNLEVGVRNLLSPAAGLEVGGMEK